MRRARLTSAAPLSHTRRSGSCAPSRKPRARASLGGRARPTLSPSLRDVLLTVFSARSAPAPWRPLAAALLLALAAACAPEKPESPWSDAAFARLTLREKAAQMVVARVPSIAPPDTTLERLRRWTRAGGGGLELPGGDSRISADLAASLRVGALRPPLVVARLERGVGGAFIGSTELPSPVAIASAGDDELAEEAAGVLAAEAKAIGIDLLLLPGPPLPAEAGPLATPFRSPAAARSLGAFVAALAEGGVLASLSAFAPPGVWRDTLPALVPWDRAALEAVQLEPLRTAVTAGAEAVEPAFSVAPALTADDTPLPLSGVAIQGLLRRDLGFRLVVADVGPRGPLARRFGALPAALGAVATGADLVVGAADPDALVDSLVAAVQTGRLPAERVERSARRVFDAKARIALGETPADAVRPPLRAPRSAEVAAAAFERTLTAFGREARRPLAGCRKTVLVTALESPVPPFSAALARRIPSLLHLQTRAVALHGPLALVPFAGSDADCAVVAVFPGVRLPIVDRVGPSARPDTAGAPADSAARARRDSVAAARERAPRRIVYVAFAPESAEPPARVASVLVVAGTGEAAQRAAARAVAGEVAAEEGEAALRPSPAWPAARTLERAPAREAGMSADTLARIDRLMRAAVDEGVFTGGVVAVGRHGKLVKMTGYGRTSGRPVDPDATLFDIASLSKVVGTTAAAMALVEDGRVRLDAPVRRYIPQFRGGEGDKGDVTIRHLLTHTSGLPAGADLFGETSSPEAALRRVYRTSLVRAPGEKVEYSDFGMILMAEVVRRRSEEPMDRFLARRVFIPLGMRSTMYEPPLVHLDRTVPTAQRSERPYELDAVVHDGNAFRLGGVAGHAGLFSTAPDMAVYAQTLLNGGAYGDRRIWSPGTVRQFTTKQPKAETRALGWDTPAPRSSAGGYLSAQSYGHTGYTGTSIWIDPARDLFVIVLTNRTYGTGTAGQILALRSAVANAAARAITDTPIRPRAGTAEAAAEIARERAKKRPRPAPRRPTRPRGRGRRG